VSRLDAAMTSIEKKVSPIVDETSTANRDGSTSRDDVDELKEQWGKLVRVRALLKEELKEDGWLIRFRT